MGAGGVQAHAHALRVYVPSDHPQVRVGSIPGPGWRRGFPCTRATRILTPLSASVSLSGLAAPLNGQIRPLMPTTASQRQSWEVRLWCHVFRGFFFFFFSMALWCPRPLSSSLSPQPCRGQWPRGWALERCLGSDPFGGWGSVLGLDGLAGVRAVMFGGWWRGCRTRGQGLAPSWRPQPRSLRVAPPAVCGV